MLQSRRLSNGAKLSLKGCAQLTDAGLARALGNPDGFADDGPANQTVLGIMARNARGASKEQGESASVAEQHEQEEGKDGGEAVGDAGSSSDGGGGSRSSNVAQLDLSNVPAVSAYTLASVMLNCRKLQALDLRGCTVFDGLGWERAWKHAQSADPEVLLHLKTLRLGFATESALSVQEELVKLVQVSQPLSMAALFRSLPAGLRIFEANGFLGAADEHIAALADTCRGLARLSLPYAQYVSHSSLSRLAAQCSGLTHLNLRACPGVDDEVLKAFGRDLPLLTFLNISCCGERVTDEGFAAVVQGCKRMADIDACYSTHLTRASFGLAVVGWSATLAKVGFSGFADLTDDDVMLAVAKLPGLLKLTLGGCVGLTSRLWNDAAGGVISLKKLDGLMLHKLELRLEDVLKIATMLPTLRGLDLNDCTVTSSETGEACPIGTMWDLILKINPGIDRDYWSKERPI